MMAKCLVVEDQPQNLYLLKSLLEGNGFEVETAVNGLDALEKAQKKPPELILSDILMPVMDGFTLCRAWMQDERLRNVPFVFYTATYTDPKDEELALSLGAARFIIKPMEPDQLVIIIRDVLDDFTLGTLSARVVQADEEPVFLKKYNQRLIQKLEDKMLKLEEANKRLTALYSASTRLVMFRPIRELVTKALSILLNALQYSSANYFEYDEATKEFHLLTAVDTQELTDEQFAELQQKLVFKLGEERGLVGLVGQNREPLVLSSPMQDPRWLPVDTSIRAALFIPVVYEDKLLGVASFFCKRRYNFSTNHVRDVMTLINTLAIAAENARLYTMQRNYANQLEDEVAARTTQLQEALEKAKSADRLKSQFISDINHELRTPLTNIKLYLGLLDQGREENRQRYMDILSRETDRLQLLIEELLDISTLDQGNSARLILVETDLNGLVGELVSDRGRLAAEKSLTLDFYAEPDIPTVLADPRLLFQVLANLYSNAINYTPAGGAVWLRTETAVSNGTTWATFSIKDTGLGVSDEEKPHIFQRFYRGTAGKKSTAPGTGLGLAICQEIMNRHNGRITIESMLGQGSKFTLWLPLVQAA